MATIERCVRYRFWLAHGGILRVLELWRKWKFNRWDVQHYEGNHDLWRYQKTLEQNLRRSITQRLWVCRQSLHLAHIMCVKLYILRNSWADRNSWACWWSIGYGSRQSSHIGRWRCCYSCGTTVRRRYGRRRIDRWERFHLLGWLGGRFCGMVRFILRN